MNQKHKEHSQRAENPLENMSVRKAGTLLVVLVIFSIIFIAGMLYASNGARVGFNPKVNPKVVPAERNINLDGDDLSEGGLSIDSEVFSVRKNDVTRGEGDVLLIEYSDFECGFCKRFHPVVQSLVDSGEVTWVYRHLPLSFHDTADEAAKIADCARINRGADAFWQFTDSVFAGNAVSAADPVAAYRSIGLAVGLTDAQMDACLLPESESSRVVRQHQQDAQLLGVSGTPGSILVNPRTRLMERIPGAFPLEDPSGGPNVRDLLKKVQ